MLVGGLAEILAEELSGMLAIGRDAGLSYGQTEFLVGGQAIEPVLLGRPWGGLDSLLGGLAARVGCWVRCLLSWGVSWGTCH